MSKTSICLAEDHTIFREGVKALLFENPNYFVISEARDGIELLKCLVRDNPDIVILDLSMPRLNGLDAIKEIKKRRPNTKVLILTVHAIEEYIDMALRSGANGYLLKDASLNELYVAIEAILSGESYLSPKISNKVIKGFLGIDQNGHRTDIPEINLTVRERELLKLIAEGYRNKEIAEFLVISIKTVEKHRSNLMRKLDIHNTASLTAFAIEKGFIKSNKPLLN
ncbi:MAG: response regulator [Gammaproteobacteria bacterium]